MRKNRRMPDNERSSSDAKDISLMQRGLKSALIAKSKLDASELRDTQSEELQIKLARPVEVYRIDAETDYLDDGYESDKSFW